MLGVYVAYSVILRTQSLLLAPSSPILVVAAVGFVMQRFFLRRFGSDPLAQMMMTMGFALMFRDGALMIWGGDPFTLQYPALLRGSVEAGDVVFPAVPPVRDCRGGARRRRSVDGERPHARRRPVARHGGRPGDGGRDRHQRGAAVRSRVRRGCRPRGIRRRDGRADSRRLPRNRFRPAAAGLRRCHHRRDGQPQGRARRQHRRRHDRQLRQGARAGAVVLHAVCADGGRCWRSSRPGCMAAPEPRAAAAMRRPGRLAARGRHRCSGSCSRPDRCSSRPTGSAC